MSVHNVLLNIFYFLRVYTCPLWIVLFFLGSTWFHLYYFCWRVLIHAPPESNSGQHFSSGLKSSGDFSLGLFILVISAILKATWLGAWSQALVITWFCDRKWRPPTSSKNIMQVDSSAWIVKRPSGNGYWIPYEADRRPRVCGSLGGCGLRISDRVYHCSRLDRCLPAYDHYCPFIKVAVYLRTIKAYLFVLTFLPLDATFSIAISIYALTRNQPVIFAVPAIVAACLVIYTTVIWTYDKFWLLAVKNIVYPENRVGKDWYLGFKFTVNGEQRLHIHKFLGKHPWDLGIAENLCQVFGHWWQWPFFWWQPERVSRYGSYADRDLPYADWVTRYRTDFLMPPLSHVSIDEPGTSSSHEQEPRRRQQRSSVISRRSQSHGSQ